MFTWICPQCGREVPPSYSECPDCAEKQKSAAAPSEPAAQASQPAAPQASQPPPQATPPPAAAAPPQPNVQYVVVKRSMPGWLVAPLVALGLVGIGAAGYYYGMPLVRASRNGPAAIAMEEPSAAPAASGGPHRLTKFVEVTGLRVTEEAKKTQVRFLVVNHSGAEIADLGGTVTIQASAGGSSALFSFPFKIPSLGPYESKELSAPVQTNLRAYELPDWQFLNAEVKLTSP